MFFMAAAQTAIENRPDSAAIDLTTFYTAIRASKILRPKFGL
jgi:hypothetical protein